MKFTQICRNLITFFIVIGFVNVIFAQEIKFSGYGSVGYRFFNRNILNGYNQESYYEGKLQADIEYNKHIEGQIDLRGNSTDNSFKLREVTVKFDYMDYMKIKVGNIKKPFGNEQLYNEEDLFTVERNNVHQNISEMGYGGRAVSLMAYYKYSKKRQNVPYSYYASFFHTNSLYNGLAARFEYHAGDITYAANYLIEKKGGDYPITAFGAGLDFELNKNNFTSVIELFYVQDPNEGILRKLRNEDEKVYSVGAKFLAAYQFDLDGEVVKKIEPVFLTGYFLPDKEINSNHVIQTLLGVNIYFHKMVKLRVNADLRLKKNQFNSDYSSKESRAIVEFQMSF
ncbi:MAG: hypothetical protein V1773_18755 [bacterium]